MKKLLTPPWFKPLIKRVLHPSSDLITYFSSIVSHDDIVRLPLSRPTFLINNPEAIYHILLSNKQNYTKAGTSYERVESVVGKGLLTSSGEDWRCRREQYQPLFYGKHLAAYVPLIQKHTQTRLAQWKVKSGKININEEMLSLVMNITAETLLGIDVSSRSLDLIRMVHRLNQHVVTHSTLWKWLPTVRNLRYQLTKKSIDHYLITQLKESMATNGPLLNELIKKDGAGEFILQENYILDEIKTFFFAGHETTGNALIWTLYCLAKNKFVYHQVKSEINAVMGEAPPDYQTIEKLTYLEMTILESLRLYPPIWIFSRKAIAEDTLNNYTIPAQGIINISPYLMHRHPQYWNQPTVFYPERFLPDEKQARPKCAYIPFGVGPHVCIGRQLAMINMKIILSSILQQFDFELANKNLVIDALPFISLKPNKTLLLKMRAVN